MTLPTIEGPVTGGKGQSLGSLSAGLAEHEYTQTEYILAGTADAYERSGDATKAVDQADYRTRIVVYRPDDAARFNGTVVVEWLNVSGGLDGSPDWTFLHREMMRSGYAWVGVSAQYVGVHGGQSLVATPNSGGLTDVDPERYGSLSHPGDTFSFDIYTPGRRGRPRCGGDGARRALRRARHRDRRVAVGDAAHHLHQRGRRGRADLRRVLRARAWSLGLTARRERSDA